MVTGNPGRSGKLGSLVRGLLHDELPVPVPQYPYEVTLERIRELYGQAIGAAGRIRCGS